ncbi:MAG TPA: hypothetical protein DCS67_03145, partial [Clostridiales bacterium UBA8960]|nr:hypothetical protein [Clostridiales bacterium UBA8960]
MNLYKGTKLESIPGGASGAKLYQVKDYFGEDIIMKVETILSEAETLAREVELIKWLNGKVLVPSVLHFEQVQKLDGNWEAMFVMSKLDGKNLKMWRHEHDKEEVAKLYGSALRTLHLLPFDDCPVKVDLDDRLVEVRQKIDAGTVDTEDFEAQYKGVSLESLWSQLVIKKPIDFDLVIAHGDYCLDNLMAELDEGLKLIFTGFIDLGRGGVQDRYQDIALALRSVRKHLGQ